MNIKTLTGYLNTNDDIDVDVDIDVALRMVLIYYLNTLTAPHFVVLITF